LDSPKYLDIETTSGSNTYSFEPNSAWITIFTKNYQEVADFLELKNPKQADSESALKYLYSLDQDDPEFAKSTFVSADYGGWTFITSNNLALWSEESDVYELLKELSVKFGFVYSFGADDESGFFEWSKFKNGEAQRVFVKYQNEILVDTGPIYPIEDLIKMKKEKLSPNDWRLELNSKDLVEIADFMSISPTNLERFNDSYDGYIGILE
jgi:hypothetical protein